MFYMKLRQVQFPFSEKEKDRRRNLIFVDPFFGCYGVYSSKVTFNTNVSPLR